MKSFTSKKKSRTIFVCVLCIFSCVHACKKVNHVIVMVQLNDKIVYQLHQCNWINIIFISDDFLKIMMNLRFKYYVIQIIYIILAYIHIHSTVMINIAQSHGILFILHLHLNALWRNNS